MDKRAQIERADQARHLLNDDLFAEMLTTVRLDALNALAIVNPEDQTAILRQQAIVAVTGEIKDRLEACITATGEKDGGYSQNSSSEE